MRLKFTTISLALIAFLSFVVFAWQISQHTIQQRVEALVNREIPDGSSRTQVEAWLKSQRAGFGLVPKDKFQDYWVTSVGDSSVRDVRKLIVGHLPDNPTIEVFFFFGEQDTLIKHEVLYTSS